MKTYMTQFVISVEVKAMKFESQSKDDALDYVVKCFPLVNRKMVLISVN